MRYLFTVVFINLSGLMLYAQTPNWAEHVSPLMFENCTPCHHPGGLAPFSLMTYSDASANAFSVHDAVGNKTMPPWPPDPEYRHLAFERILSQDEINTIQSWVQGGSPEGNPALAPAPPVYNNVPTIVSPDLLVTIPTYTSTATNGDIYRCFVIPSGLTGTKYITEMEVIPGNPEIVHHVLVFQDSTNTCVQLDNGDPLPGYSSFGGTGSNSSSLIGTWVPGSRPTKYPQGMGIRLPANTNIVVQIHYPQGSNGQSDNTQVRFKLTNGPVRQLFIAPPLNHGNALTNGPLIIPANTVKTFNAEYTVPINISTISVGPHMHLIGRKIKVYGVVTPGDTIPLIRINDWNFHWQGGYEFKNVTKIPAGTKLRAEATYDNTLNNPYNPSNPPQLVTAGEATTDEMMLVYFTYTYYFPGDENIVIDSSPNTGSTPAIPDLMFSCFPNPSAQELWIETGKEIPDLLSISVYDIRGNEVLTLKDENPGIKVQIPSEKLPSGEYLIILRSGNQYGYQKWIKSE